MFGLLPRKEKNSLQVARSFNPKKILIKELKKIYKKN